MGERKHNTDAYWATKTNYFSSDDAIAHISGIALGIPLRITGLAHFPKRLMKEREQFPDVSKGNLSQTARSHFLQKRP